MAKNRTFFTCQNCGSQSPKWLGKCPDCAAWNTFVEEQSTAAPTRVESARGLGRGEAVVVSLDSDLTEIELPKAVSTGFQEFDRVLGGGFIPGSFTLIGGDPGIGKSTRYRNAGERWCCWSGIRPAWARPSATWRLSP